MEYMYFIGKTTCISISTSNRQFLRLGYGKQCRAVRNGKMCNVRVKELLARSAPSVLSHISHQHGETPVPATTHHPTSHHDSLQSSSKLSGCASQSQSSIWQSCNLIGCRPLPHLQPCSVYSETPGRDSSRNSRIAAALTSALVMWIPLFDWI